ncbi:MAG TPA: O-antigen ligase family protein [Rhodothermia bacterium]|nr:O-antigen ligase family protein [Rhodothermia bacterium]
MRKIAYGFVWIFAATIPLQEMAASTFVDVSGTISRVVGLAAAMVAIMALIYEGRLRPFSVAHGIIMLFLAWGGFSFLWSADQPATFARLVTNVQLAAMILIFCQFGAERKENHGLVLAYVVGATVSLAELFRRYMSGVAFQESFFTDRYTAFDNNPNDYALALAIAIPMAWFLIMTAKRKWELVLGYAYMGAGTVGVLLTGSRGGLIAAVVAVLVMPLSLTKLSGSRKLLTAFFVVAAVWVGIQVTPQRVLARFETLEAFAPSAVPESYYGELEGPNIRTVVWKQGIREFLSNPQVAVVGVGAGAYMEGVEPIYGERFVAHNVFISILVEQGIVGFALFFIIIYLIISPLRYLDVAERYLWRFAFLSWAAGVTFMTWEQTKNTWFLIGVLAARIVSAKMNSPKIPSLLSGLFTRGGLRLHAR